MAAHWRAMQARYNSQRLQARNLGEADVESVIAVTTVRVRARSQGRGCTFSHGVIVVVRGDNVLHGTWVGEHKH